MNESRLDPETLAAFLDGTLEPAERERVLAILADSPEDASALLEASRIRDDIQGANERTVLRPRKWIPAVAGLAATLILGIGVVRFTRDRGLQPGVPTDSLWVVPPWSASRGGADAAGGHTLIVRLGARMADLETASRAGATATARQLAAEIAASLAQVEASGPAVLLFQQVAGDRGERVDIRQVQQAVTAARILFDNSPWIDAGAALASARIAAIRGDTAFFQPDAGFARRLGVIGSNLTSAGDSSLARGLDKLAGTVTNGVISNQLPKTRRLLDSLLATPLP